MIGIDLFAGAGGMSLGAKMAGVRVETAVELNAAACETYAHNHPDTDVVCVDIANFSAVRAAGRKEELVLFGGPPCQGFSTANQRTRKKDNPRNWLFLEFLRQVEAAQPEWILFENVSGILQTDGGSFIKTFMSRLSALGYDLTGGLLNAADFGCPQRRTRFFLIGARDQRVPKFPSRIPTSPPTLIDAIGDLPLLENGALEDVLSYGDREPSEYAKRLRGQLPKCSGHLVSRNADHIVERYAHIPQGGNWRNVPGMMRDGYDDYRRYHTSIYHRLDQNLPSIVIGNFRKSMLVHPTQDRGLSVREAARLQSFPDSYKFFGSIGLQQQQVGNAVPPVLAAELFKTIKLASELGESGGSNYSDEFAA